MTRRSVDDRPSNSHADFCLEALGKKLAPGEGTVIHRPDLVEPLKNELAAASLATTPQPQDFEALVEEPPAGRLAPQNRSRDRVHLRVARILNQFSGLDEP